MREREREISTLTSRLNPFSKTSQCVDSHIWHSLDVLYTHFYNILSSFKEDTTFYYYG